LKPTETGLQLPHGLLCLPAFLPDATQGVVRGVDASDLIRCGVEGLVMNTFHLMQNPGSSTIQTLGGLHRMTGWPRPIVTDSGGFQVYSLIRQNRKYGSIGDQGIIYRPDATDRKFHLTPEKTIQQQLRYDADVVICLDDCTHADDAPAEQLASVRRTIAWAKRCKQEFERILAQKRLPEGQRPQLFAVIQGGADRDLRKRCAEELLTIGFDGYGYGGWPLDGQGNLLHDIIAYTRQLVPPAYPMHALGVGHPANVVACAQLGYDLFDSAMPTRDARHGRLYVFTVVDPRQGDGPDSEGFSSTAGNREGRWFTYVYVGDDKHVKANGPVSPFCDCAFCTTYSLGYLHHLFKIGDSLFLRLATIHNLRFMVQLMERLQGR
jgi:queuine tRNA-ribosyltransferase